MMRHLTQLTRALTALLTLIGFTFGVPVGLFAYIGWPLPTTLPNVDQIQLALRSGIDPQLLVNTLAVIVWIVWAQLAVAVTVEVAAAVRGRVARRLRLFPGLQSAAAQLVAAITLTAATIGPLRTAPVAAAPLPASISITAAQPTLHPETLAASRIQTQPEQRSQLGPTYRVLPRDTLWSIAETTLGDGRRWQEIRALNQGRTMGDGHSFTATTDRVTPGWLLVLPDDATTPPPDQLDRAGTGVTVEAGDSFWTIAMTTLAEGWGRTPSEVETAGYSNQLIDTNRHRPAPPHHPDLIYPGQHFLLPPIPTDPDLKTAPPERSDGPSSTGFETVTVETGDSFWSIAQSTLVDAWDRTPTIEEITGFWQKLVDVNLERLAPPHDPNLIYPGQIFGLPAVPNDPRQATDNELGADSEPAPDTTPAGPGDADIVVGSPTGDPPAATTTPTVPADATPTTMTTPSPPLSDPAGESAAVEPTGSDDGNYDDTDDETGAELAPIASTLAGLGLLAAGLIALLRRLRNTQFRQRRADTIPTPPPAHARQTETMLRTAAAPTSAELIDLALRSMARNVLDTHRPAPQVVGVHLDTDRLRLLLWTPHQNPPAGWQVEDEGRSWTLRTDVDLNRLADMAKGIPAPYPALVTVGHADHAQLLVDLEFMGATQITGTPDDRVATCYTMATELAASPIADDLQIVCIGFGTDLAALERVHVVEDLSEILPTLAAKTEAVSRLAAPSPLQGRLTSPGGDTWDPIIVFDPTTDPPHQAGRLLTDAHTGRGVAAVVGYPTGDRWRLHLGNDTIRIEPLGLTLARRNLIPAEQTAVCDLITAAKDLDGTEPDTTTDPPVAFETIEPPPAPTEQTEQQPLFHTDVNVVPSPIPQMKVLGTLRVDAIDGRFPLRKCTELVAYLTFHRGGVEADTLMEALWPEQRPDYQRVNRHTSRTRTTLGLGPDEEPYLPYVADGIYRISAHLRSDIEEFTRHIRQADQTSDTDQAHNLRAALELVEGTPFTGAGNAYTWAHTNGIITHAIVAIDNAAHRLAQHALANDDPDQATWAARKGLLATGACEECYRNLMRAAAAEANQVAFEAVYTELLAVIDADEGPDASSVLDPDTVKLYEQDSRRRRRQAG